MLKMCSKKALEDQSFVPLICEENAFASKFLHVRGFTVDNDITYLQETNLIVSGESRLG